MKAEQPRHMIRVQSPTERCDVELPDTQREFCGVPIDMIGRVYVGGASVFAGLREVVAEPAPKFDAGGRR